LVAITAGLKVTGRPLVPDLWSSKNTWDVSRDRNFHKRNFTSEFLNVLQPAVINFRKLRPLLLECDVVERMLLGKIQRIIRKIGAILRIGVGCDVMPEFRGVLFVMVVVIVLIVVLLVVLLVMLGTVRLPVFPHR
jgi:hypothetical protein